LIKLHYYL